MLVLRGSAHVEDMRRSIVQYATGIGRSHRMFVVRQCDDTWPRHVTTRVCGDSIIRRSCSGASARSRSSHGNIGLSGSGGAFFARVDLLSPSSAAATRAVPPRGLIFIRRHRRLTNSAVCLFGRVANSLPSVIDERPTKNGRQSGRAVSHTGRCPTHYRPDNED